MGHDRMVLAPVGLVMFSTKRFGLVTESHLHHAAVQNDKCLKCSMNMANRDESMEICAFYVRFYIEHSRIGLLDKAIVMRQMFARTESVAFVACSQQKAKRSLNP